MSRWIPFVHDSARYSHIGCLELFATRRKRELQNEKLLPTKGFEPTTSRFLDWRSNVQRYWEFDCRHYKVNDIHINIDTR